MPVCAQPDCSAVVPHDGDFCDACSDRRRMPVGSLLPAGLFNELPRLMAPGCQEEIEQIVNKAIIGELQVPGPYDVRLQGLPLGLKTRLAGIILKWIPPTDLLRAQEDSPFQRSAPTQLPTTTSSSVQPLTTPPRPIAPSPTPIQQQLPSQFAQAAPPPGLLAPSSAGTQSSPRGLVSEGGRPWSHSPLGR